jgi:hypothetical protein
LTKDAVEVIEKYLQSPTFLIFAKQHRERHPLQQHLAQHSETTFDMTPSPAVAIAILFLTLFAIFALLAWWLKTRVHTFIRAIFKHRQEKNKGNASTVANSGESV